MIVDNNGAIKERLSFNPWGERRKPNWTEATTEIESISNRGFTGHEMDDEIGLVNMNARIYDPIIGRFLSPDALIPQPNDLQSYNRYSYVRNNPLSFTDPTGHFRVPGSSCGRFCTYHFENGSFYKVHSYKPCQLSGDCRGVGAEQKTITEKVKVTDPGLIRHLGARIGVAQEIITNHGGLHRGNTKGYRNQYRAQAAAEAGCPSCSWEQVLGLWRASGQSARFNALVDKAQAANDLYLMLKRQARKRYRFQVIQLAVIYAAPEIALAGPNATAGQIAGEIIKDVAIDQALGIASDITGLPLDTAYAIYNIADAVNKTRTNKGISEQTKVNERSMAACACPNTPYPNYDYDVYVSGGVSVGPKYKVGPIELNANLNATVTIDTAGNLNVTESAGLSGSISGTNISGNASGNFDLDLNTGNVTGGLDFSISSGGSNVSSGTFGFGATTTPYGGLYGEFGIRWTKVN